MTKKVAANALILAAMLITVVRYGAAFYASDVGSIEGYFSGVVSVLMGITGFGMGILDVIGATYLFDGWRNTMPKTGQKWPFRFRILTFFVFGLFLVGLTILIPFTVSRITHTGMDDTLSVVSGGVWWWATAVNLAPYLLIGGVAVGQKVFSEESSAERSESYGKDHGNFDWRKARSRLSDQELTNIAYASTTQIMDAYGLTQRTARNWKEYAAAELEQKGQKDVHDA